MKLKRKILTLLSCVAAVFSAVLFLFGVLFIQPRFVRLQKESIGREVNTCRREVEIRLYSLEKICQDWSGWDDAYRFAQDGNQAFIDSNLVDETMTGADVHLIYICDKEGNVMWGKVLSPDFKHKTVLSDFPSSKLDEKHWALQPKLHKGVVKGVFLTEEAPLLVVAMPILKSNRSGPPNGTMIMGRFLSESLLKVLIQTSSVEMSMTPLSKYGFEKKREILSRIDPKSKFYIERESSSRYHAYWTFKGVNNEGAVLLFDAFFPATIEKSMSETFLLVAVGWLLGLILIFCALYIYLNKHVLKRVSVATEILDDLIASGHYNKRFTIYEDDELARLGRHCNRLLDHIETSEELLQHRLALESLIMDIMSVFLNVDPENFDREVEKALEQVGAFVGASEALIALPVEESDKQCWVVKYSWASEKGRRRRIPGTFFVESENWETCLRETGVFQYKRSDKQDAGSLVNTRFGLRHSDCFVQYAFGPGNAAGFLHFSFFQDYNDSSLEKNYYKFLAEVFYRAIQHSAMEIALRNSEKRFRLYFDLGLVGMAALSPVGRFLEGNERVCRQLGFSQEELKDMSWKELTLPEDWNLEIPLFTSLVNGENSGYEIDKSLVHRTGRELYAHVSMKAVRDDADSLLYIALMILDITDRKAVENELRENETRLKVALSSADMGVWRRLPESGLCLLGAGMDRILGVDEFESRLTTDTFMDMVYPEDKECVAERLGHALEKGMIFMEEYRIVRKDGTVRWLRDKGQPLFDDNGRFYCLAGAAVDITSRKLNELALVRASKAVDESANAKSRFLANMSHEIRTPLNSVIGFSELLSEEGLNEEQGQYAAIIHSAGKNLLAIVNDILDFSKMEVEKLEIFPMECSPMEILNDVECILGKNAKAKKLDFQVICNGPVPGVIKSDKGRLTQCLLNLVNNAVKFTEKGRLYVYCSLEMKDFIPHIRFDVEDTGIGIPEEMHEKIFESFSQVDDSSIRSHGGTGLGLAICKKLVALLDGTISLKSKQGEGSVFTLTVPTNMRLEDMKLGQGAGDSSVESDVVKSGQNKGYQGKVLVVEDNPANQVLLVTLLRNNGITPDLVGEGRLALKQILAGKYELVFLDIQIPGISGYKVAEEVRKQGNSTTLVATTAHALKGDSEKCFKAGCDDYIAKPINFGKVEEVLEKYLKK